MCLTHTRRRPNLSADRTARWNGLQNKKIRISMPALIKVSFLFEFEHLTTPCTPTHILLAKRSTTTRLYVSSQFFHFLFTFVHILPFLCRIRKKLEQYGHLQETWYLLFMKRKSKKQVNRLEYRFCEEKRSRDFDWALVRFSFICSFPDRFAVCLWTERYPYQKVMCDRFWFSNYIRLPSPLTPDFPFFWANQVFLLPSSHFYPWS